MYVAFLATFLIADEAPVAEFRRTGKPGRLANGFMRQRASWLRRSGPSRTGARGLSNPLVKV